MNRRYFVLAALGYSAPAAPQDRRSVFPLPLARGDCEEFLRSAAITTDRPAGGKYFWRAMLDDGKRKHYATIETEAGTTSSQRHYRGNIAAYELDKILHLTLVPPVVKRLVGGQPASVTWWVDDVAMNEIARRKQKIEPPDAVRWNGQMQAVRVFDELIANQYRDVSPASYLSSGWDNLLITRDWRIWLIDHTVSFRPGKRLEHPETLVQCDRGLFRRLRELDRRAIERTLSAYLNTEQLDALEARRRMLVEHFEDRIASQGEAAVLYDLWAVKRSLAVAAR